MKYIITAANTNKVINRRVYLSDPNSNPNVNVPPSATVHEVADALGDTVQGMTEDLEVGEFLEFDGTTPTIVRAVDAVTQFPFMRQLRTVLRGVKPEQRASIHGIIGPSMALDDVDAAIAALTAFDDSGLPARAQQLKADILTVFGREVARRLSL